MFVAGSKWSKMRRLEKKCMAALPKMVTRSIQWTKDGALVKRRPPPMKRATLPTSLWEDGELDQ
jgi:hypothetical protein